jgi:hypothetical protein
MNDEGAYEAPAVETIDTKDDPTVTAATVVSP